MKVTITSIELKNPLKFFALSGQALKIIRQLQHTPCVAFKKKGFWTTHYTMTLWSNEEALNQFARSGAHLESMQNSRKIAKSIKALTYEADALPDWEEAIQRLKQVKGITFP
ncbi:MAG: DUF3291 domain-containing protein [Candidatus Cyclobacteriaceae bacterium M3_2C_046]